MQSSGHSQVLRRSALLAALLFLFGSATCSPDNAVVSPELTVVVNVAGLTPDISSLFVTSTLNSGQAQASPEITGRIDQFALALPLTTTGHLSLNVVGRSAEH